MAQRYFLIAETTYESLRVAVNAALGYPTSRSQSVFQPPLQAPRDGQNRILLAVDSDLPGFATVSNRIDALLLADEAEELSESQYLSSISGGVSAGAVTLTKSDVGLGNVPNVDATARANHTGTQAIGTVDGLQAALDGKAASSHSHGFITSDGRLGSASASAPAGRILVTGTNGVITSINGLPSEQVTVYLNYQTGRPLDGAASAMLYTLGDTGYINGSLIQVLYGEDYVGGKAVVTDENGALVAADYVANALQLYDTTDNNGPMFWIQDTDPSWSQRAIEAGTPDKLRLSIGAAAVSHAHSAADISGLATVATSGSAADLTGTLSASRLPSTTVTAGSYGSASSVGTFTVDSAGRLTAAGSTSIAISAGAVSGLASIATSGSASDLGSGTVPIARIPVGATSSTVTVGNDARLVSDGNKGDITVGSGNTVWTINAGAVTTSDLADGAVTNAKVASITASKVSDFAAAVTAASPEEVLEYLTPSNFPATGNSSLLYIATDNAKAYRWVGSQYAEIGPAQGYVATHTHAASDIVSGTIATARLGSGATSTTFLRGDQTYADPVTYATTAQAQDLTATTVAMNPANVRTAVRSFSRVPYNTNYTANGGSVGSLNNFLSCGLVGNASANGTAVTYLSSNSFSGRVRQGFDWSLPTAFNVSVFRQTCPSTGIIRFLFGCLTNPFSWTTLDGRGIGFEIRQSRIWVLAHNGSSLTSVDSGIDTFSGDYQTEVVDIWIRSDGAGNVTLTRSLNGGTASSYTTTGGPTATTSGTGATAWTGVNNGATASSTNFFFSPHLVSIQ